MTTRTRKWINPAMGAQQSAQQIGTFAVLSRYGHATVSIISLLLSIINHLATNTYRIGFRIDSPMETAVSPCKQRAFENDWTYTGQSQTALLRVEPDLVKVVEVWPQLSSEMRNAIIKMIS